MKIKFGTGRDPEWTEINVGSHEVLVQECFTGLGMETDQGIFGIAMRDSGIEVMLDGKLVWSSASELPTVSGEDRQKGLTMSNKTEEETRE